MTIPNKVLLKLALNLAWHVTSNFIYYANRVKWKQQTDEHGNAQYIGTHNDMEVLLVGDNKIELYNQLLAPLKPMKAK